MGSLIYGVVTKLSTYKQNRLNCPSSMWKMDFRDLSTPNYITNGDIGEMSVNVFCLFPVGCFLFFFVFFLLYWVSATVHELLLLPHSMWDFRPRPVIQPTTPALESGFLATDHQESPYMVFLSKQNNFWISQQHLACLLKVKH